MDIELLLARWAERLGCALWVSRYYLPSFGMPRWRREPWAWRREP